MDAESGNARSRERPHALVQSGAGKALLAEDSGVTVETGQGQPCSGWPRPYCANCLTMRYMNSRPSYRRGIDTRSSRPWARASLGSVKMPDTP
jgi:hypothetical protein